MIKRYEGDITLDGEKVVMPSNENIPPKEEWTKHSIFSFNGKRWQPLTQKAEENVDRIEASLKGLGYSKATKPGKLKPSSLKYAILTTGAEPFSFEK